MKNNKAELCLVVWRDASYSFSEKLPEYSPPIQVTNGFLLKETEDYINLATNMDFDSKTGDRWPVDGFVIPKKTILKMTKKDIRI